MHTALSLDLGTTIGWCIGRDGIIEVSGYKSFYLKETHPGYKFVKLHDWLVKFRGVNEIFYEDVPRFMSNAAARVYCGMLSVVQAFAYSNSIPLTNMKATSVKKEFTGSGRAEKIEVCRVAHEKGWAGGALGTANAADEADACAIYSAIMKRRGVEVRFAGAKLLSNPEVNVQQVGTERPF